MKKKELVSPGRELWRRWRESGLCLEDIAGVTRLPLRDVYEVFSGIYRPSPGVAERIAEILGCEPDEIFPE